MPTYDYECKACGKTFEVFQPISEARKKKCPACGKPKLERLIGAGAGFIFKGSGFYITDYRSADYKAKAKAESDGGAKAGAEGGSPGEKGEKKKEPADRAEKAEKAEGAEKAEKAEKAERKEKKKPSGAGT